MRSGVAPSRVRGAASHAVRGNRRPRDLTFIDLDHLARTSSVCEGNLQETAAGDGVSGGSGPPGEALVCRLRPGPVVCRRQRSGDLVGAGVPRGDVLHRLAPSGTSVSRPAIEDEGREDELREQGRRLLVRGGMQRVEVGCEWTQELEGNLIWHYRSQR